MPKELDEFSIIEKYFAPLSGKGSYSFKDDAARITPAANKDLVITQDACAEGIHFFSSDDPGLIAKKAVRVNLSDLAAKGAKPKSVSLALGLGENCTEEWISEFASGLGEDLYHFDLELSGGDTFNTGSSAVISITAIGEVPTGSYVSRLGAAVGDIVYVTGTIGDAALGLKVRTGELTNLISSDESVLADRYLLPRPRTELAPLILEFASASMDVSDGLIADVGKLCSASKKAALIHLPSIPLSQAAANCVAEDSNWLETCVTGGDDYEILFTVPSDNRNVFETAAGDLPFGITKIGEICVGDELKIIDGSGQNAVFEKPGYLHRGE